MVRLFHTDDSATFRLLVREVLAGYEDVEIVGEAEDADGAVAGAERLAPDVMLLDLIDPTAPLELVERVLAVAPATRVVIYTGYAAGTIATSDRVAAYVEKSATFEELHAAIMDAAASPI